MNKKFHNFLVGVSVLPALLVMPAMATTTINAGEVLDVTEGASGQNLDGQDINSTNKVQTNITHVGMYQNRGTLNIGDNLTFSGNYAPVAGGVVYNSGVLNVGDGVVFEDNRSLNDGLSISGASEMGAAIYSEGTASSQKIINIGDNVEFNNNIAYSGAAIYLFGNNNVTIGDHVVFANNQNYTYDFGQYGVYIGQSGAINITQGDGYENGYTVLTIGDDAQFLGNKGSDGASINVNTSGNTVIIGNNALFKNNDGAAVFNNDSTLTIGSGAVFENNTKYNISGIQNAAGLVNYGTNAVANLSSATFTSNIGGMFGGAVYNEGTLTINGNSMFGGDNVASGNVAGNGGAVYNEGTLTVNGGIFNNNIANGDWVRNDPIDYKGGGAIMINDVDAIATIRNSQFKNNQATGQYGMAGALYVFSGTADVENTTFDNNTATYGGAIYTRNKTAISDLIVKNSTFVNNSAEEVGAVAVIRDGDFSETRFAANHATLEDASSDGAGAMFIGAEADANLNKITFESNTSGARGGAMSTRAFKQGINSVATLDINNSTFTTNTALTTGGALDNYLYGSDAVDGSVYVAGTIFDRNFAANGGAVYNHIGQVGDRLIDNTVQTAQSDVNKVQVGNMYLTGNTFTGNIASEQGGAIYNEGIVTLAGTNTFTGNTANGLANDIHNVGSLTVASGTTTMDGGITGDGTLSIANGATLNIGTASVNQSTIDLAGTLIATVRSGDAQLTATDAFAGDGTLSLIFNDAGTYHVFGDKVLASAKNRVSSTIYDLSWTNEDKDVTATLKSVAAIAEENNLSENSAAAILGMSQSSSEKLNEVAMKMQEKLASGNDADKAEVEHAAAAVHPENESVTQSVATSVQTTVTNLAGARMAAPTIGRSGGDVNFTSGGVWAQGLFNKSKQNDAFNGYTRGIAAGMDGTINKVWKVGAGYSFAHSDITSVRDTEIDSNTVFLYGQYKPAEWYVNAVANYTWSDFSETADVLGTAKTADYDVNAFGGTVATGYNFASGVTPELGLRYLHVNASDYTDSFGSKIKSKDTDFLTGVLGAKYAFNVVADKYTTFIPQLNAAIKYDMLSDKNVATVTMPGVDSYTLRGERLNRLGGEFGIGLGMKYRAMDFSINYDIDVRKDYTSQTGMLKFRYNF